jgi:hypothetical protein
MSAVTRTGGALSWLANAPLSLLRRGMAASGSSAGLLTSPLTPCAVLPGWLAMR